MSQPLNFQPTLQGSLVKLEPLTQAHTELLAQCAANLSTWADYPVDAVKKTGNLSAWFTGGIECAQAIAIFDVETGNMIGTTRYYTVPGDPDGVGIGYTFIHADYRRSGQTNAELKSLMFAHAFEQVSTIWFHVLPDNLRSQAAVKKLGVVEHGVQELHLTDQPRPYVTFSISKESWAKLRSQT